MIYILRHDIENEQGVSYRSVGKEWTVGQRRIADYITELNAMLTEDRLEAASDPLGRLLYRATLDKNQVRQI